MPTPSCGACRKFLYELYPEMSVASESRNGDRKEWRLWELLLDGFGRNDLATEGQTSGSPSIAAPAEGEDAGHQEHEGHSGPDEPYFDGAVFVRENNPVTPGGDGDP